MCPRALERDSTTQPCELSPTTYDVFGRISFEPYPELIPSIVVSDFEVSPGCDCLISTYKRHCQTVACSFPVSRLGRS